MLEKLDAQPMEVNCSKSNGYGKRNQEAIKPAKKMSRFSHMNFVGQIFSYAKRIFAKSSNATSRWRLRHSTHATMMLAVK
jgi:hypothetical protein